jgi:hypothetical protein
MPVPLEGGGRDQELRRPAERGRLRVAQAFEPVPRGCCERGAQAGMPVPHEEELGVSRSGFLACALRRSRRMSPENEPGAGAVTSPGNAESRPEAGSRLTEVRRTRSRNGAGRMPGPCRFSRGLATARGQVGRPDATRRHHPPDRSTCAGGGRTPRDGGRGRASPPVSPLPPGCGNVRRRGPSGLR